MATRDNRDFYLVQRLIRSPYENPASPAVGFEEWVGKSKANPFRYGRMGDYELDYMGSAQFEFGAIPEANDRLAKAGDDLVLAEHEYKGHVFDFLYIGKEGEPFAAWEAWLEGGQRTPRADGKAIPHELLLRLDGKQPPSYGDEPGEWQTALWWALDGNVIWSFKHDGHMNAWLESMGTAPTEFLR